MDSEIQWNYWLGLYLDRFCLSRGLSHKSVCAYRGDLGMFRSFILKRKGEVRPSSLRMNDILEYIRYLQEERHNGVCAVNRQIMSIKSFYRAMVAFEEIQPRENPMRDFPKLKPIPRKLPKHLSENEIKAMIKGCDADSIVGVRDRALLILLYGTGIRASECAGVTDLDIDFENKSIHVTGKGGHQRCVPLKDEVIEALKEYRGLRGEQPPSYAFFRSMRGNHLSRGAIYERVRKAGVRSKLEKRVSPHKLRHSFATHIIRTERNIQVVSELLGHRHVASTQIYVHVTGRDLMEAIEKHPIEMIVERIERNLVGVRLPFKSSRHKKTG